MTDVAVNAEQIVALARKAAREAVERGWSSDQAYRGLLLQAFADSSVIMRFERWQTAILVAPLTPENVASPYALARALLKSAVKTHPQGCCGEGPDFDAWIGAGMDPTDCIVRCATTEDEAVAKVLDALLPAEAAR